MIGRASAARWAAAVRTGIDRLARLNGPRNIAVMALSGSLAALALPPLNILPALFTFTFLMLTLDHRPSLRSAFATGWAFAFGYHIAGLYWISNALLVDGDRFCLGSAICCSRPASCSWSVWRPGCSALRLASTTRIGQDTDTCGLLDSCRTIAGHIATGFPWNLRLLPGLFRRHAATTRSDRCLWLQLLCAALRGVAAHSVAP